MTPQAHDGATWDAMTDREIVRWMARRGHGWAHRMMQTYGREFIVEALDDRMDPGDWPLGVQRQTVEYGVMGESYTELVQPVETIHWGAFVADVRSRFEASKAGTVHWLQEQAGGES